MAEIPERLARAHSRDRKILPRRLSKQLYHGAYRQEEPSLDSGEFEKSILLVKRECCSVFRIDDDTCGSLSQAVLKSPMERIHQQCGAIPLSAERTAYGQPAEKRRWHHRICRQFFRNLRGNIVQLYRVLRQRVVADDGRSVRRDD